MGGLDLFAERDTIDVGLRLLDHQIVGEQDELLGNVDNLELRDSDDGLLVTGLVVGPAGLGPRWPARPGHWPRPPRPGAGRFGRWVVAIWSRLNPSSEPQPLVLPMSEVASVGSAVELTEWGATVLAGSAGFELWLRRYLVGRLPGAKGGEDRLAGQPIPEALPERPSGLHPDARMITDLLGAEARTAAGRPLGVVLDVGCEAFERGELVGRLRVTSLLCGTHQVGARLGYAENADMGPWLVARLVRRLHQGDRRVPISAVESIDWATSTVTVDEARTEDQARKSS